MVFLQVAIGGALGAMLRYGIGLFLVFPFGTLAVNVLGCPVLGRECLGGEVWAVNVWAVRFER